MKYKIAYGESRKARKWANTVITLPELKERLSHPLRTSETVSEYHKMKPASRAIVKDKGGFVAGELKDGLRKASAVISRSMLTMDVDNASRTFLEKYSAPYLTLVYSTHSHTPEEPRLRIILPLKRDVTPEEYQAITRLYAAEVGINQFDPCSFVPSQLMYWPTVSRDGEYVYKEIDGEIFDPDAFLSKYPDWEDPTALPITVKERPFHENAGKKAEDPLTKKGIVGTFCRAMGTVQNAIDKYLGDVYERVEPNRYRLRSGSGLPGVLIYEDKWAYSNHATDPAYHIEANAFDIVRIHLFGDSFDAMAEWAASQPEVSKLLLEEQQEEARQAFEEGGDWHERLERNKRGDIKNTLQNLGLIMANDEYMTNIVYNQLSDSMEIVGAVPWKSGGFWRDVDDAQLMWYVEQNYGTFSERNYNIAVPKFADDRGYHPIKDYLSELPAWDRVPRVDTLLIDYLGASDNEYVRAVTRKTLCAAVKRIYTPGIKFDCILILNGPQGIGKSTLIAKLGMEWFSDSLTLSDMNDKTAAEKLQGYWIHEIGEMAGMRKADLEKVKSFISRQDDKYRAAFGHRVTPHPRQCVFFGTTNAEDGFLRDVTGNRRYWVVSVPGSGEKKPWELTQEDINQIWAEVLVKVEAGEELYLTGEVESIARREQSRAMERDEREGLVRMYLDTLLPEKWDSMDLYSRKEYLWGEDLTCGEGTVERQTVSNMEIWCECFGNTKEAMKPSDSYAISSIMSRIEGWTRSEKYVRCELYGKQRIYMRDGTSDAVMEVVL